MTFGRVRMQLLSAAKFGVYLGVRTHELFLCFVAIVTVRVYYVDFFVLSLVSFTGSYTEAEPICASCESVKVKQRND